MKRLPDIAEVELTLEQEASLKVMEFEGENLSKETLAKVNCDMARLVLLYQNLNKKMIQIILKGDY